jgi:hypothetical protein
MKRWKWGFVLAGALALGAAGSITMEMGTFSSRDGMVRLAVHRWGGEWLGSIYMADKHNIQKLVIPLQPSDLRELSRMCLETADEIERQRAAEAGAILEPAPAATP